MSVVLPARPRRSSPFLRSLRAAVLADFEPELDLCERVAVLVACGYRESEIAKMLDVGPGALRRAEARVKKAAKRLDNGD